MGKTGILIALLLPLVLAGCLSLDTPATASGSGSSMVGLYRLRELDPLQISLLGIPEEKMIESVIDEHGNITVPYVEDPVPAAGLTTSELERELQRIYTEGEIYRDITVNVQTYAKIYYMEGEVKQPMQYSLTHRVTLLQAIAAASGYTEYANRKKVSITRNGQVMWFDTKRIERNPELDVPIEAGDRIKVWRSPW